MAALVPLVILVLVVMVLFPLSYPRLPVLVLVLFLPSLTRAVPQVFSSGRSCNLVKSSVRSGTECFTEPQCRQECTTVNQQQCANPAPSTQLRCSP